MRKVSVALALLMPLIFVIGCSKTEKTYKTKDGTATVKTDKSPTSPEKTVEVKTKDGATTVTTEQKKTVTEAELGVPVYPGATAEATAKYEGKDKSQMQSMQQYVLMTPDSFEKVEAFYKANLKNVQGNFSSNQGDQKASVFVTGTEKAPITVTIGFDKDKKQTMIHVMKTNQ